MWNVSTSCGVLFVFFWGSGLKQTQWISMRNAIPWPVSSNLAMSTEGTGNSATCIWVPGDTPSLSKQGKERNTVTLVVRLAFPQPSLPCLIVPDGSHLCRTRAGLSVVQGLRPRDLRPGNLVQTTGSHANNVRGWFSRNWDLSWARNPLSRTLLCRGHQGSPVGLSIRNAVAPRRTQDGGKGPLCLHQAPVPGINRHHDQLPCGSTTLHQTEHHTAWRPRAAYPHGSITTWRSSKRALWCQQSWPVTRDIRGCALGRRRTHMVSAFCAPTSMKMKLLGSPCGLGELLVKEPLTPWSWRLTLFKD